MALPVERGKQLDLEQIEVELLLEGVYRRYGFSEVGKRRAYYPVVEGPREDALLMSLGVSS